MEEVFLETIRLDPTDEALWQEYAAWLEEQGEPRAEVLRILSLVGFPSNLVYYPAVNAQLEELRKAVPRDWFDEVHRLREELNRSANPGPGDVERLWHELEISPITRHTEEQAVALSELLTAAGRYLTVGALVGRFAIAPHPVLRWYGSRDRWAEMQFLSRFVQSAVVRRSMPGLNYRFGRVPWAAIAPEDCHYGSATRIADQIATGGWGACAPSTGPKAATFRKALDHFAAAFFGPHSEELHVAHTDVAWAPWFCDEWADHTLLVMNKVAWEVTLMCFTSFEP
jgi:uncharacterized protein (TIGR02996 family)